MRDLSRRSFGMGLSVGALGGLAAGLAAPVPALPQGEVASRKSVPKRTTTVFRELVAGSGVVDAPSIHDPLTAKIAESVGFQCVHLAGSALGLATCQVESALSLDGLAEVTREISQAIAIPLSVDAGGGFGEPTHVFHAVQVLEHAGAAGICIDDQVFPKRFHYYMDGRVETIPFQEMVEKLRYAVQARRDRDFVIGARTDAISTGGFAEGIRRANLYLQAGADYVLLFPRTLEEVRALPKEVSGPLNFANAEGTPNRPSFTTQALGEMGWKLITHPEGVILTYYKTIREAFLRLKDTGSLGMDAATYAAVHKEAYQTIGITTYYDIEYWTSRLGSRGAPGAFDPSFKPKE
jgi:2-methylisocitrate lyase-like PEP mutase family enzyme